MGDDARVDTAVIGAGPYGLATSAHLRAAGVETRTLGRPLSFWKERMPVGMRLRSSWGASSISHPHPGYSLDDYQAALGRSIDRPIPVEDFIAYGSWFQQQAVPDVDERPVTVIEPEAGGFAIELADGSGVQARRVVIATGLDGMAWYPPPFDTLDARHVTHAIDVHEPAIHAGSKVMVIGSGQSAVETAVLLHEAGAEVEIVARTPEIHWLTRSGRLHALPERVQRMLYAPTDVGPPGLSWIVAKPDLFRRLPRSIQKPVADRSIRPAASGWLVDRSAGIAKTEGHRAVTATAVDDGVDVVLDDGTRRRVDHVVLGTGYRVDVNRHELLAPELRDAIVTTDGLPELSPGFESSVEGLYFVGAAAAGTYGPLMRFVSGTPFAAATLAASIASAASTPSPASTPSTAAA